MFMERLDHMEKEHASLWKQQVWMKPTDVSLQHKEMVRSFEVVAQGGQY